MQLSDAAELRQRNRKLAILNSIAQTLNRSTEPTDAMQTALAQVIDLLELQTGWLWLLRESDDAPYLAAAQHLPPALSNLPETMEGSCHCLNTFREGDLSGAANVNVVECSRLQGLVDGTDGLRFHASIPLYAHGKKLGVLNVASVEWRQLSEDDLQLLYTIGDMLGIAVERARLFERSVQMGAVEERNRLAREIHDTLAQGLTAVSLQLESADALLETGQSPENVRTVVQHALDLTRASLDEARRSVMDLRAAPLDGRTLPEALAELTAASKIPAKLTVIGGNQPLSPRIEIGVYRLAQEAITNANRHAKSPHLTLTLRCTLEMLTLTVIDDGVGFDAMAVPNGRFGLIGMNERVKLLDGQMTIESGSGMGTRLHITIPL